jgi:hypothetical protein
MVERSGITSETALTCPIHRKQKLIRTAIRSYRNEEVLIVVSEEVREVRAIRVYKDVFFVKELSITTHPPHGVMVSLPVNLY